MKKLVMLLIFAFSFITIGSADRDSQLYTKVIIPNREYKVFSFRPIKFPIFGEKKLDKSTFKKIKLKKKKKEKIIPMDTLIMGMIAQESTGNDSAIHKVSGAAGPLQILKSTVDDINNKLGEKVYTYSDRFSREKSIEMLNIYVNFYLKGEYDPEKIAKLWNQGPGGMYLYPDSAEAYWNAVKRRISQIKYDRIYSNNINYTSLSSSVNKNN